jgi:hypothetical protein
LASVRRPLNAWLVSIDPCWPSLAEVLGSIPFQTTNPLKGRKDSKLTSKSVCNELLHALVRNIE